MNLHLYVWPPSVVRCGVLVADLPWWLCVVCWCLATPWWACVVCLCQAILLIFPRRSSLPLSLFPGSGPRYLPCSGVRWSCTPRRRTARCVCLACCAWAWPAAIVGHALLVLCRRHGWACCAAVWPATVVGCSLLVADPPWWWCVVCSCWARLGWRVLCAYAVHACLFSLTPLLPPVFLFLSVVAAACPPNHPWFLCFASITTWLLVPRVFGVCPLVVCSWVSPRAPSLHICVPPVSLHFCSASVVVSLYFCCAPAGCLLTLCVACCRPDLSS